MAAAAASSFRLTRLFLLIWVRQGSCHSHGDSDLYPEVALITPRAKSLSINRSYFCYCASNLSMSKRLSKVQVRFLGTADGVLFFCRSMHVSIAAWA
jgi:hypothetical protein